MSQNIERSFHQVWSIF